MNDKLLNLHTNSKLISRMIIYILPIQILAFFCNSLCSTISTLFLGNYIGELALSAKGLYLPISHILTGASTMVCAGASTISAKHIGKGEYEKVNKVFTLSFIFDIILGLCLTLLINIFAGSLASFFGASGELHTLTTDYFKGLSFGFIFQLLIPLLMTFAQIAGLSKTSFFSPLLLALFTLIFSFLNVKVFDFGIYGMGLAIAISYLLTAIIIVCIFIFKKTTIKIDLKEIKKGSILKIVGSILILGCPGLFSEIFYGLKDLVTNSSLLKYVGSEALSANSVAYSVAPAFIGLAVGVGQVNLLLNGLLIGCNDERSIKYILIKTISINFILQASFGVVFFFTYKIIGSAFGCSDTVNHYLRQMLVCLSASWIFYGTLEALKATAQAHKHIIYVNIINFFNAFAIGTFILLIFVKNTGYNAVLLSTFLGEALSFLAMFIYSIFKNKRFPKHFSDIGLVDVTSKKHDHFAVTVSNLDEVINISQKVQAACISWGIDKKRSMYSALMVEELATNICKYGFTKKNKVSAINIIVYKEEDDIYIKMLDNGIMFDPLKVLKENEEDKFSNIGIRVCFKLAKDMNYQYIFKMNFLSIKL